MEHRDLKKCYHLLAPNLFVFALTQFVGLPVPGGKVLQGPLHEHNGQPDALPEPALSPVQQHVANLPALIRVKVEFLEGVSLRLPPVTFPGKAQIL